MAKFVNTKKSIKSVGRGVASVTYAHNISHQAAPMPANIHPAASRAAGGSAALVACEPPVEPGGNALDLIIAGIPVSTIVTGWTDGHTEAFARPTVCMLPRPGIEVVSKA